MAERLPYVQQNRTVAAGEGHGAQEWRWMHAGAAGPAGVCGAGDLKVAAATGLQLTVAAGGAFVSDGASPIAGLYHVFNDGPATITLDASHLTLGRIDLVIAEVTDTAAGGTADAFRIRKVTGTAASSPAAPAVPARSLVLAQVSVAANASSIVAGNITDRRVAGGQWAQARGLVWSYDASGLAGTFLQSLGELDTIFTQTVATVPGRRYTYGFTGVVIFQAASDAGNVRLLIGGTTFARLFQSQAITAGNSFSQNVRTMPRVATGTSHELSATMQRTLGTGAMTLDVAFAPVYFTMYDEGGSVL